MAELRASAGYRAGCIGDSRDLLDFEWFVRYKERRRRPCSASGWTQCSCRSSSGRPSSSPASAFPWGRGARASTTGWRTGPTVHACSSCCRGADRWCWPWRDAPSLGIVLDRRSRVTPEPSAGAHDGPARISFLAPGQHPARFDHQAHVARAGVEIPAEPPSQTKDSGMRWALPASAVATQQSSSLSNLARASAILCGVGRGASMARELRYSRDSGRRAGGRLGTGASR
jgi:hypothetical protein